MEKGRQSIQILIAIIVIGVISCILWRYRFKFLPTSSLLMNVEVRNIKHIEIQWLEYRKSWKSINLEKECDIEQFFKDLKSARVINSKSYKNSKMEDVPNSAIACYLYGSNEELMSIIRIYPKYIEIYYNGYDNDMDSYVIQNKYYENTPDNYMNEFLDDYLKNYSGRMVVNKLTGEVEIIEYNEGNSIRISNFKDYDEYRSSILYYENKNKTIGMP